LLDEVLTKVDVEISVLGDVKPLSQSEDGSRTIFLNVGKFLTGYKTSYCKMQ